MVQKIKQLHKQATHVHKKNVKPMVSKVPAFIDARPLLSLGIVLLLLFTAIAVGRVLRSNGGEEAEPVEVIKKVTAYTIGEAPRVALDAEVEKSGVITISAQTAGVVQSLNVSEGQDVWQGATLIGLSTNYQGGNTFSLQRQLAQAQFANVQDTYQLQKDTIERQRELARDVATNDENLREIQRTTNAQTEQAIHLNDEILKTLEKQLALLVDEDDILAKRQVISQYKSANLQLNTSLQNGQYTADEDGKVANISVINRDVLLSQLELQEKALNLSRETAQISYQIAAVNEALMYPGAPFEGRIEKIHVRIGQSVTPGTPLVTLSGAQSAATATVYVPYTIANTVSTIENSVVSFGDISFSAMPIHVSREAVRGQLYAIMYAIPVEYQASVTDKSIVQVSLPIGARNTSATVPFVPIESVYQSDTASFVYLAVDGVVESREVVLGSVNGGYVAVTTGLTANDQVLTDRNVIEGDSIELIN